MKKHCQGCEKVLVVISDGAPIHVAGRHLSCTPPESVMDAATCVKKIEKDGTRIVAIALEDDKDPCYEKLCNIYSNVIECRKLSSLPKQILEVVAREISSRKI